jgi:enoyl-CoA hydratase
MAEEVLTERRDNVLLVTINRPEAKNAVNEAVAQGVAAAMDELDGDDDLRVGVITGAGGTFCAGMDLKAFLAGEVPVVEGRGLAGLTERPPRKPLIAAVEGWALAGGFEVALACDLVVAAETARFGVPEVKRGLVAAAGAALRLPSLIPQPIALELLLTGDPIDAERASGLGLVNRVVPEGTALDGALELAATIAANGPRRAGSGRTRSCRRSSSPRTPRRGQPPSRRSATRSGKDGRTDGPDPHRRGARSPRVGAYLRLEGDHAPRADGARTGAPP